MKEKFERMPRYITDVDTIRVLSEYYHHRTEVQRNALVEAISRVPTADAIEELQKDLERSKDFEAFWQHAAEETLKKFQVAISNKPRWIPVTERLPEYMENVLVTDGVFSGMGWRDWYDYRGAKPREDYWIAPNTNVNELNITHWMPLPEPPKEET